MSFHFCFSTFLKNTLFHMILGMLVFKLLTYFYVFVLRICKDNSAREFASCLIPQEMSNEEINAELGISDASCDEDTSLSLKNIGASATSKPAGTVYTHHMVFGSVQLAPLF